MTDHPDANFGPALRPIRSLIISDPGFQAFIGRLISRENQDWFIPTRSKDPELDKREQVKRQNHCYQILDPILRNLGEE